MRRWLSIGALLLSCGCQGGLDDPQPLPSLDRAFFDCQVQPVLTKTCAGFACHGAPERYFTVFARNRLRFGIASEDERNAFMNAGERSFNFNSAAAQVDLEEPLVSLLLVKPLEQSAGGYFHRGAEIFNGGDVFADTEDRDYQTLLEWVNGALDAVDCVEPGSEL